MPGRMQRISPIRTQTVYGADEKVIGRHTDGRDIIERTFMREVKEAVLDDQGKQVWKVNQLGQPISPIFRLVPTQMTEVYVYDEANGHNNRNRDFRPSEESLAQRARLERIETLRDDFFEAAEERGLTAEQIVAGFSGVVAPAAPQQAPAASGDDEMETEVQRRVAEALATRTAPPEEVLPVAEQQVAAPTAEERKREAGRKRQQKARDKKKREAGRETAGV